MTTKAYVCEKHFMPDDILWHRKLLAPDGRELRVEFSFISEWIVERWSFHLIHYLHLIEYNE